MPTPVPARDGEPQTDWVCWPVTYLIVTEVNRPNVTPGQTGFPSGQITSS